MISPTSFAGSPGWFTAARLLSHADGEKKMGACAVLQTYKTDLPREAGA
jgi:hypothetical protein